MPGWISTLLLTVGSVLVTLTVTLIFNRLTGLPKELRKQRDIEEQEKEKLAAEAKARDQKIATLEAAVASLPGYRAQSIQIQQQLQAADTTILATCQQIQLEVSETQRVLNERLDRLEKRERNALRAKILDEYRLMTDEDRNPLLAWSEMEAHAFFELVKDYEDLNGNDYVHSVVLPAVNELKIIEMSNTIALTELMHSRKC
jgi:hypothetical protein